LSSATLTVSKIRNGTVIDHIPAGRSLAVLKVLGITGYEGLRIAILMNVESKKLGTELEFVIMVIAVSCVKLLSAHNSTQHTSRKHKV